MDLAEKKALLVQAWKEVFEVDDVKDDADFFEEGGDSIKAVQLSSWLLQKGIKLDLGKIFYTPALSQMAEVLEETDPVYVPEEMATKELIGQKVNQVMQQMGENDAQASVSGQAASGNDEQICDPDQMKASGSGEQICDPDQMKASGSGEQICDPDQMQASGSGEQICDPDQMQASGSGEQICDPNQMQAPASGKQACDPNQMQASSSGEQVCDPAPSAMSGYVSYERDLETGMMMSLLQTLMTQQQMMLQMMQMIMMSRMSGPSREERPRKAQPGFRAPARQANPPKAPWAAKGFRAPASKAPSRASGADLSPAVKAALQKEMEKYHSHKVSAPIQKPNVIGIKPAKVTKPEHTAEEVLDHVLSGIFKKEYSKTADLFEQGLTSLDTVKMVTRCGEHGYALSMQDIYMHSTFEELVKCMTPGQ